MNKLEQGNYMKKSEVIKYLGKVTGIRKDIKLPEYGEGFYLTNDLKTLIPNYLFQAMECHVTTYMIGVK